MLGSFLANSLAWFMGETVGAGLGSRARDRRAENGTFDFGFRVVSGRHRGLGNDWRIATGTISPGRIRMENLGIVVNSADLSSRRKATLRDTLAGYDTVIFRLTSDNAD